MKLCKICRKPLPKRMRLTCPGSCRRIYRSSSEKKRRRLIRNNDRFRSKIRETNQLVNKFGTTSVLLEVKRNNALQNVTKKCLDGKIKREDLKNIIYHILCGRTYEGYRIK